MELIDSHAHIYLEEFDNDRPQVVENAQNAGIQRIYLPNIDSGSIEGMLNLCEDYPDFFRPMMGLHPTSVDAGFYGELEKVGNWLDQRNFAAIGEIGIDLYWDKTFYHQQKEAFQVQLKWAMEKDMPIVIHSRDSFQEIFQAIDEVNDGSLHGIFHSFSGTLEEARHILELGFYIGINGIVTFKNSTLDEVVRHIDIDRLVLETDSPFLAPVPRRGKRNESSYVRYVADKIAEVKQLPVEEVAQKTTRNANRIFLQ
jgi:TatD DNase family protein